MKADELLDEMVEAGSKASGRMRWEASEEDGWTEGDVNDAFESLTPFTLATMGEGIRAALRVFVEKHDLRSLNDGKDLPNLMLCLTNMATDLLELTDTEGK